MTEMERMMITIGTGSFTASFVRVKFCSVSCSVINFQHLEIKKAFSQNQSTQNPLIAGRFSNMKINLYH